MKNEDVALGAAGAVAEIVSENVKSYAINCGLQSAIGTTVASKAGALATKITMSLATVNPAVAFIVGAVAIVGTVVVIAENSSSNYNGYDYSDEFFPAMSGLYSG